ncbi:MAG: transcription-repair coupling factor [Christensenellales bacterium]
MKYSFLEGENVSGLNFDFSGKTDVLKVCEGAKLHIVSCMKEKRIYVVADKLQAKKAAFELEKYGNKVVTATSRDDVLLYRKNYSKEQDGQNAKNLAQIVKGDYDVIVTSVDMLAEKVCDLSVFSKYVTDLKVGENYNFYNLSENLTKAGYTRQDGISDFGDFSIRGDVVDVFAYGRKNPLRLSFFDDELESIKEIDLESGDKVRDYKSVYLAPSSDIVCDREDIEEVRAVHKLTQGRVRAIFDELAGGLKEGPLCGRYSYLLPMLRTQSLLDLDVAVVFDEPKIIEEKLQLYDKEFNGRFKTMVYSEEVTKRHATAKTSYGEIKNKLTQKKLVGLSSLSLTNTLFTPDSVVNLKSKAVTKYCYDYPSLIADLKGFAANGFKIALFARNSERAKSVADSLFDEGISPQTGGEPIAGKVTLFNEDIEQGFLYPDSKLLVVGSVELVGKGRDGVVVKRKKSFAPPKEGDYVVHSVHGVGICEGTAVFDVGEFKKEYLSIRYEGGDHLYVAIDQMDNITKFIGEENPPLNKLGGKEFKREKEKVKKSVRQIAINLVNLYAEREKMKGHVYQADTIKQRQFEDAFIYEETPDQLETIATIKQEMEKGKVIDRLICGDVGFGKTEVAFRAMFKTVMEGKQAALLAPTTILAKQHYETLKPRLEPFGIRLELLTRFQTAAERKEIIDGLKNGDVQMIIATHRILSKEVEFFDLGLLVLDEEQRFGVEHKEKLKERNPGINVLTLSATPIPRTLNMSLSGVRDISLLETPPLGRLPVETYVVEYSDGLVADAVKSEVARGGQVFVLYNKVESISQFTFKLSSMLDGIRVRFAHGQMSGRLLEDTVEAFYEKEFDVLVATTIIENGIDLPDANTLIVIDSQNFGLSQLYQLRGRVGRRGALAKAYFTVPPSRSMTEDAEKRFDALLDNTEIGSGFKISLADLSIRGAGNILGAEQHGHIEKVGYEMYLEILEDAIKEIKTGIKSDEENIDFKIDATTYISSDYVSSRDKIKLYKRIASVSSINERNDLLNEIELSYGTPERGIKNLINIALIKNRIKGLGVKSVIVNRKGAGVNFTGDEVFSNDRIIKAVSENRDKVVLTSTIPPTLVFNVADLTPEEKLDRIAGFFCGC